jgi:hypothetical protein
VPYETDERLKSYLDTNQLHREQMCLSLLAIDKRFTNVQPRHPRGGPDGGRDIVATFKGAMKALGAIGFVNQANDSNPHKTKAKNKFNSDLEAALRAEPGLQAFVFFTNVSLTASEKQELVGAANTKGIGHCEIFDRERMRIALDGADGLAIRFQFLSINLSDAEQAAFFARWGDDIQNLIAEGFSDVKKTLNRMQFLHEANSVLEQFYVLVELDREYDASEIGHFRLFCNLHLKEPKNSIFEVEWGATDNSTRIDAKTEAEILPQKSGIESGMCGGHWEIRLPDQTDHGPSDGPAAEERLPYECVTSFTSVGMKKIRLLKAKFGYDSFIRLGPSFCLKDLDDCLIAIFVNRSLSEKIKAIHFFGNEYKLFEVDRSNFRIDTGFEHFEPQLPFSSTELSDEWVRIMNTIGPFQLRFSSTTPLRMFDPIPTVNSLKKVGT